MRLEIFVLGLTAFFVYNAYNDGKYTKMMWSFKKYYKMIFYVSLGVGIYTMLKKNPNQGRNMLLYANNMVKFLPIDKNSMDMLSPIMDFTSNPDEEEGSFMETVNGMNPSKISMERRMLNSGKNGTKRSVSNMRKKYVASQQGWKCGHCKSQLDHTYEIDHKIRLDEGGGNDVQNLIALCPSCHRYKTAEELM